MYGECHWLAAQVTPEVAAAASALGTDYDCFFTLFGAESLGQFFSCRFPCLDSAELL